MPYDEIALEAEDKMDKAVGVLAEELRGVRTGRASAALVDGLKVDAYGTLNPLKSLASITVPEPRMILVKPFDPGTINDILKAIQKSEVVFEHDCIHGLGGKEAQAFMAGGRGE